MSVDFMVYDLSAAPQDQNEFLDWYDQQTEWSEDHGYNDPAVTTPELRAWFFDMIKHFPALNGPHAADDPDNPRASDYCIGRSVFYVGFWSELGLEAGTLCEELAEKHKVGFFNPQ